jgi:hypothetical protein
VEHLNFKIDGIYDVKTKKLVSELGISQFTLDFNPRGPNFCPLETAISIMSTSAKPGAIGHEKFYLYFDQDSPVVIKRVLEEIKKELPYLSTDSYQLEFYDQREAAFFDQFNHPYIWHYQQGVPWKSIAESKLCKGIVLNYRLLEYFYHQKNLSSFLKTFYQITAKNQTEMFLKIDWGEELYQGILDQLHYDTISLPINQKVEICYRNVDLNKVQSYFIAQKNHLLSY